MNNPIVHFSLTQHRRDTDVSNAVECTWQEFKTLFAAHEVWTVKDSFMICPWIFKDTTTGKREADNTLGTDMICLDFDDDSGWSIEDAKGIFGKYTYVAYTSFNHQKNGKDRFKMFLPLNDVYQVDEIRNRRDSIYEMYDGIDISSLSVSRSFYIPSCPQERKDVAKVWSNDGQLLDLTVFKRREYQPPSIIVESPELTDGKRKWILESLHKCFIGKEPEWRVIGLAMAHEGFTFDEFCYATVGGMMHKKTVADCARKWKDIEDDVFTRGVTVNMGHIINVLKKRGHVYNKFGAERGLAVKQTRTRGQNMMEQLKKNIGGKKR